MRRKGSLMGQAQGIARGVGIGAMMLAAVALGGCRTTVQKVQMERVDQAPGGNGGYLVGKHKPSSSAPRSATREIAELQVELPTKATTSSHAVTTTVNEPAMPAPAAEAAAPAELSVEAYTVKKGDTLWSIAKKMYGKGSLWSRIYEANRDQLPEPSRLRAGMRLQIPRSGGDTAKKAYEK